MKKIDKIRRISNKELRLTKELMGELLKSSEYCGPIRTKSYNSISGIVRMAYNPFINEDIQGCYFDSEQPVLLRFWLSRISMRIKNASTQVKRGLVLKEKVTAPFIPKPENSV